MAYPWLFTENFEGGSVTNSLFNSETDSSGILDIAHYSELARYGQAPYRGAYALRVRANGGTTAAYLFETDGFDTSAAGTIFIRFYFYLGKDFQMADTNKFSMFEAESVANTTTDFACGLDRSGSDIRFWVAETSAASASTLTLGTTTSVLNKWYCVELNALIDSGVGDDGTLDAWVDGTPLTQITGLDQGAIVNAKLGIIGPDAGTKGTILYDNIIADDARIFPEAQRFNHANQQITNPHNHPMVGPGRFSFALTGTSTDATAVIYDSDGVPDESTAVFLVRNVSANESVPGHDIFEVQHGAYITLAGTNPQAFLSIDCGGMVSAANYVDRGRKTRGVQPQARSN